MRTEIHGPFLSSLLSLLLCFLCIRCICCYVCCRPIFSAFGVPVCPFVPDCLLLLLHVILACVILTLLFVVIPSLSFFANACLMRCMMGSAHTCVRTCAAAHCLSLLCRHCDLAMYRSALRLLFLGCICCRRLGILLVLCSCTLDVDGGVPPTKPIAFCLVMQTFHFCIAPFHGFNERTFGSRIGAWFLVALVRERPT